MTVVFLLITFMFIVCQIALVVWDDSLPDRTFSNPKLLAVIMMIVYVIIIMMLCSGRAVY